MKPPVERMGLEEKHPTGKNRSEGKAGGFVLGWGQSSGSRTRGLALCPRNCKLRLVQTGRAAPLSTAPFSSCQGTDLMDLPTCCSSHPCPKLAGLEVPVRQPKAVSCGKDVLRRQPEREDGQGC